MVVSQIEHILLVQSVQSDPVVCKADEAADHATFMRRVHSHVIEITQICGTPGTDINPIIGQFEINNHVTVFALRKNKGIITSAARKKVSAAAG